MNGHLDAVRPIHMPHCMGFIMDGNRRWARAQGLPSFEGHRAGGKTLKDTVRWVKDAGIGHVIFFTFSTENWSRSAEEVSYLLNLIGEFIENELDTFHAEGGVLHFVGDLSRFPERLRSIFEQARTKTAGNAGPHVYFALNYGGRAEILSAVRAIANEKPSSEDITEDYFARYLQTEGMPDPDLIVRTSGEMRLSGFLPWQSVYSELFFTKTFWPDFSREEFDAILAEYAERERRHGR